VVILLVIAALLKVLVHKLSYSITTKSLIDRPIFYYSLFSTFVVLVISAAVRFSFDYFKLLTQQHKTEAIQLRSELNYLKTQLNPHFLFNTLNNLLYLTRIKANTAPLIVEKLSEIMRYITTKSTQDKTLLASELEFMDAYIELEKIRVTHININCTVTGIPESKCVPPLIVLPLIENAFKHGVDKSKKDNFIDIQINILDTHVKFTLKNARQKLSYEPSGIGLDNLRKRLELIYNGKFSLEPSHDEKTYIISLETPYI